MIPNRRDILGIGAAFVGAPLVEAATSTHSKDEINVGQTMPYSGPLSSYATIGRLHLAYFRMLNERGGINGRRINLISLDDGYNPARTVEQVRKLVERDEVSALFQTFGTPGNTAIHKYVNARRIPHLFISSGASKWNDPSHFAWSFGFNASYRSEGQVYAKYLLANRPQARIAILYQNDDFGKDLVGGMKKVLGTERASRMIVAEATYEVTDPTVDSQVLTLMASGADTFINVTAAKFAAQALRRASDLGWRPLHFLANVSASVGPVLNSIGADKVEGTMTMQYLKEPTDPTWASDPAMLEWRGFMTRHYPEGDVADWLNVYAYVSAQLMVQVLLQCGSDLRRENIREQAENLRNFRPALLLPGMEVTTSPQDHAVIKQGQLARFDGKTWRPFGPLIEAAAI